MITLSGVSKSFGGKPAVRDVSFQADPGAITYLLGPNGAGKSTTMRMIAGLTAPDSGSITISGQQLDSFAVPMREVRFSLNSFARNPRHTAAQHLRWQARLGGLGNAEVSAVLDRVGLAGSGNRLVGRFSLGMLARLGIATALLGDPRVLVLDEPDNGLDVDGILWLRELLTGLAGQGRTLLVASHNLTEVELTADRIVIMGRGRVLTDATVADTVALGSGPRRLESAYLAVTRESVEYGPVQDANTEDRPADVIHA